LLLESKLLDCVRAFDRKVRAWEVAVVFWGFTERPPRRIEGQMAGYLMDLVDKGLLGCQPEPSEEKHHAARFVYWVKGSGVEI
jgi:hypothetical protein